MKVMVSEKGKRFSAKRISDLTGLTTQDAWALRHYAVIDVSKEVGQKLFTHDLAVKARPQARKTEFQHPRELTTPEGPIAPVTTDYGDRGETDESDADESGSDESGSEETDKGEES